MNADSRLPKYIIIGKVTKPHGVRGALKIEPLTDDPKRFEFLKSVFLGDEEEPTVQFEISRVQFSNKQVLLSLHGIDSMEAADRWRNFYVQIPIGEVMPLAQGRYYYFELVGLAVYTDRDQYVGSVHQVVPYPANDMYVVHADDGREILIPDVPAFIREINMQEKKLIITPIDGLLE